MKSNIRKTISIEDKIITVGAVVLYRSTKKISYNVKPYNKPSTVPRDANVKNTKPFKEVEKKFRLAATVQPARMNLIVINT